MVFPREEHTLLVSSTKCLALYTCKQAYYIDREDLSCYTYHFKTIYTCIYTHTYICIYNICIYVRMYVFLNIHMDTWKDFEGGNDEREKQYIIT